MERRIAIRVTGRKGLICRHHLLRGRWYHCSCRSSVPSPTGAEIRSPTVRDSGCQCSRSFRFDATNRKDLDFDYRIGGRHVGTALPFRAARSVGRSFNRAGIVTFGLKFGPKPMSGNAARRDETDEARAMRRVIQVAVVGVMAAPLKCQVVWPLVFHLWPPACQAPDGSTLLCLITDKYTRPRDLTAVGISLAMGLIAAVVFDIVVTRRRRSRLGLQ